MFTGRAAGSVLVDDQEGRAMTIDLLFITYNRLKYTKLALASVLADPSEEFSLTIWDNASTDGTVEYLKNEVSDPRIKDIVFSRENVGQLAAVNEIWSQSKADLLGKLDNDCLVTPGWTKILAKAHADIPTLGVVACWHFPREDFDYQDTTIWPTSDFSSSVDLRDRPADKERDFCEIRAHEGSRYDQILVTNGSERLHQRVLLSADIAGAHG